MFKKSMWFGAVLALAGAAHADADKSAVDPVEELKCLVGTWHGKGQLEAGGETAKVRATYECVESSGGRGVKCTGEVHGIPGLDVYRWDGLWGYDAEADAVHWFTVTNAGETHDHAGKLGPRRWDGRYEGTREGQPFVEEILFRFENRSKMRVKSVGKVRGKAVETLSMTFEKANG